MSNGKIEGCNSYINIQGSTDWRNYVGGIVGFASYDFDILNCNNYGTITGKSTGAILDLGYVHTGYCTYKGGILGNIGMKGNVQSCNNYGNIKTTYENTMCDVFVGGIAGYNIQSSSNTEPNINQCKNYVEIEIGESTQGIANRPYIGGICGDNYTGIIAKCSNTGIVINRARGIYVYGGGICGMSQQGAIVRECSNAGSIINEGEAVIINDQRKLSSSRNSMFKYWNARTFN